MIVTHSDFHSNPFSSFRHTPPWKSPSLWVILLLSRVTPLYYHYSNEPFICDAFDNTHVKYINDTLHIIRSVFKTPIYTLYQMCKICVSFAVQYIIRAGSGPCSPWSLHSIIRVRSDPVERSLAGPCSAWSLQSIICAGSGPVGGSLAGPCSAVLSVWHLAQ